MAKADSERGGHRPKKGLLRGGKNRKEKGYVRRAVVKVAAGGRRSGATRGLADNGEERRSEETHGGSAAFVAL